MRNKELIRNLTYAISKATANTTYTQEEQTIIKFLGYAINHITEAEYKRSKEMLHLIHNDYQELIEGKK